MRKFFIITILAILRTAHAMEQHSNIQLPDELVQLVACKCADVQTNDFSYTPRNITSWLSVSKRHANLLRNCFYGESHEAEQFTDYYIDTLYERFKNDGYQKTAIAARLKTAVGKKRLQQYISELKKQMAEQNISFKINDYHYTWTIQPYYMKHEEISQAIDAMAEWRTKRSSSLKLNMLFDYFAEQADKALYTNKEGQIVIDPQKALKVSLIPLFNLGINQEDIKDFIGLNRARNRFILTQALYLLKNLKLHDKNN